MKRIVFTFTNGQVNGRVDEVVEFEDDADEKEINDALSQWLWEQSDATWYEEGT